MANQPQQDRCQRWRIFAAGSSLIALVAVVAMLLISSEDEPTDTLPQLVAGQIVEATGKTRLPSGKRWMEVSEDDSGNLHIEVYRESTAVRCIPFTGIPYRTSAWAYVEHSIVVESERDWFVSADQYDRIWVYYGRWAKEWGALRKMPGGGTHPYAPAVIMHGLSFLDSGGLSGGVQSVGDTGDWGGVPATFLNRVRAVTESGDVNKMAIPAKAPTFTTKQAYDLNQLLKQAS